MPTRTTNGGVAASPESESASAAKKFELPALDFQFSSLTEGTDIPPPDPSPVEVPTPPKTPKPEGNKDAKANGHQTSPTSNADSSTIAVKHSQDDVPLSPTLSSHGSIRRLISKTLLNNSYANGETDGTHPDSPSRPESRATTVGANEKKARRTSSIFRRLRGGDRDQKRGSIASQKEVPPSPPKPQGPPPPMIPELNTLGSKVNFNDEGSLGSDLFKNIK